jgi:hypothetical protein
MTNSTTTRNVKERKKERGDHILAQKSKFIVVQTCVRKSLRINPHTQQIYIKLMKCMMFQV